jgi:neurofibromin 1
MCFLTDISIDLCIPSNSSDFIVSISESLAKSEIHLTLEFLNEALIGFSKSSEPMRQLCLDYMVPWLRNLALFAHHSPEDHRKSLSKTKDLLKLLIDLTVRRVEVRQKIDVSISSNEKTVHKVYKHIQSRVWKTIAEVDNIINLVLDCFVQYSVEHGIGSMQAEIIADTLVTMSSVSIRGKVISRMRRVIKSTVDQPCRHLIEHPSWNEIAVLLRFILMLSFNNTGPVIPYTPEIFHIVSILVVTGPTLIRSSVHELVVNTIHTLCTMGIPLAEENIKKLHYVLNDVCDSKNRVLFGLTKQHANAFTITKETTSDFAESIDLTSLQNIIRLLLDALNFGAPTVDIANMWRARWMGLVTSTAFHFNPAIQPRSFVTLGCLAQDEVDDDLIYQILVALKGALAIFNESDSSLIVSIMMCLSNIIDNLPSDSRYLLQLFWLAIALVQVGHHATFQTAVQFLQSVLRALDSRKLFVHRSIEDVLLEARLELGSIADDLDNACGINFKNYFSFAVAVILLKGLKQCENKDVVFQCLTAFLEIDSKRSVEQGYIEARTLGYLAGLLPFAAKDATLRELLRLAGINDVELDTIDFGASHVGLFDVLEIPDNSIALLLISLLVALLNASENESERLFLYTLLADAATSVPEVFALM